MITANSTISILKVALLSIVLISGCTSVPLSKYARPGDLVTVPLGGSKTVANSNYLTRDDLSVTITDSIDQEFPVTISRLFRVYADPTSRYALNRNQSDSSQLHNIVYADEGQWMLQFNVPSSNDLGETIETGLAQISISATEANPDPDPKNRRVNTDLQQYNDDMSNMPIEILSGSTRSLTLAETYSAQYMQNGATIMVSPDTETLLNNNVGGAVITVDYDQTAFLQNSVPHAVKNSPDQAIQLITRKEDQGNDIVRITAIVMNPRGFVEDQNWAPGLSYYDGLNVAVAWDDYINGNQNVTNDNWQNYFTLVNSESYYFDLDGNIIQGVAPTMTKVR